MTVDECIGLLVETNYMIIVGGDGTDFFAYACPSSDDGLPLYDKQLPCGESCDSVEAALESFVAQFSRD